MSEKLADALRSILKPNQHLDQDGLRREYQTEMYLGLHNARAALVEYEANGGWVPIADIPDEWKDGRRVDLWLVTANGGSGRLADCLCLRGVWVCRKSVASSYYGVERKDENGITKVTRAMLPPSPPKDTP